MASSEPSSPWSGEPGSVVLLSGLDDGDGDGATVVGATVAGVLGLAEGTLDGFTLAAGFVASGAGVASGAVEGASLGLGLAGALDTVTEDWLEVSPVFELTGLFVSVFVLTLLGGVEVLGMV